VLYATLKATVVTRTLLPERNMKKRVACSSQIFLACGFGTLLAVYDACIVGKEPAQGECQLALFPGLRVHPHSAPNSQLGTYYAIPSVGAASGFNGGAHSNGPQGTSKTILRRAMAEKAGDPCGLQNPIII